MTPLTPEAVAQMVADLEAGTPGPWSLFSGLRGRVLSICIGRKPNGQRPCIIDSGGFESTDLPKRVDIANARRIARLPDLEAAYLTLAAENATLQQAQTYSYIGKDMKTVKAVDLENERDALRAERDAFAKAIDEYAPNPALMARIIMSNIERGCDLSDALEQLATLRASEAAALERAEKAEAVVAKLLAADKLRDAYHAKPNDHNRIGDKKSPKHIAKTHWLRAFNRAVASAKALTPTADKE